MQTTRAVLNDLVLAGRREYGVEYSSNGLDGLQNHLPMCLYALHAMGASDQRLLDFYDWYVPRLTRRPAATGRIERDDWRSALGRHTANAEYFELFSEQAEGTSIERLLHEYLPELFSGVGGGGFHPLIRLAYALEMQSRDELCEALAAWCMVYAPLGEPELIERRPLHESVTEIASDPYFRGARFTQRGILRRMQQAAADPRFAAALRRSAPPKDGLVASLAKLSLHTFLSAPSFVTLHLVTSSHALRVVDSIVPLRYEWLVGYWTAWLAAYVSLGAPDVRFDHTPRATRTWAEVLAETVAADDDHLNKLVYSCRQQFAAYDEPLYLDAADLYCARTIRS